MRKQIWSSIAIVFMAILALGSTKRNDSSLPASAIQPIEKSKVAKIESQSSAIKLPAAKIQENLSVDSEVESTFAERMARYERELVAWNAASDSRTKLANDLVELKKGIQSHGSDMPMPPPENKE